MALVTRWHVENRIVLSALIGNISIEELMAESRIIAPMVTNGKAPVHVIVDTTKMGRSPTNLMQVKDTVPYLKYPNMGVMVIIGGNNPLVRFMSTAIGQLLGVRLRVTGSLDEAEALLRQLDATLAAQ